MRLWPYNVMNHIAREVSVRSPFVLHRAFSRVEFSYYYHLQLFCFPSSIVRLVKESVFVLIPSPPPRRANLHL